MRNETLHCSTDKNNQLVGEWRRTSSNFSAPILARQSTYVVNASSLASTQNEAIIYACWTATNASGGRVESSYRLAIPPRLADGFRAGIQRRYIYPFNVDEFSLDCDRIISRDVWPPIDNYTWYVKGKTKKLNCDRLSSRNVSSPISFLQNCATLQFKRVDDLLAEWNYTCVATNFAGEFTATFKLYPMFNLSTINPVHCPSALTFARGTKLPRIMSVANLSTLVFLTVKMNGSPVSTLVSFAKEGANESLQCCISRDYLFEIVRGCAGFILGSVSQRCILQCHFTVREYGEYVVRGRGTSASTNRSIAIVPPPTRPSVNEDNTKTTVTVGFAAVAALVVISSSALLIWIRRRRPFVLSKRSKDRIEYDYDFLIAYVEEDWDWVDLNLVNSIESDDAYAGVTLFIHHHDFVPGQLIIDNIEKAIDSCWKVFAVVSRRSIGSAWCQMEWSRMKGLDESAIIPLVIDNIGNSGLSSIAKSKTRVNLCNDSDDAVRNKIRMTLNRALQVGSKKRDVFLSFDSKIDSEDRLFLETKLKESKLSLLSAPPCKRLDRALCRCIELTGKAVCYVSASYAENVWPLMRCAVLDRLKYVEGQYEFILLVGANVNPSDLNAGRIDCVKIVMNDSWLEELEDNLRNGSYGMIEPIEIEEEAN